MGVLSASPRPFPPPPDPVPWTGIASMTWASDYLRGSVDLLDPASDGLMLVQDGVRGLSMPPIQRWSSVSPALDGSRWRGHRVQEREVFWPLLVWSDAGTDAWLERDSLLWRMLRPDETGTWTVATPRDGFRSLRCRFVDDGDHSFGRDPLRSGWTVYGIRLVAEQPYWEGEKQIVTWDNEPAEPFLPGPPFTISGSNPMDEAVLDNYGDVAAWPVWTVQGPCSSAEVGVGNRKITIPFEIGDDETLVIDTRPDAQTAIIERETFITTPEGWFEQVVEEVDRTADLGAVEFAPVPAGEAVELSLTSNGGWVRAELTPLFFRAWG